MKKNRMKKLFTAVMTATMVFASTAMCFAAAPGTATQFSYPRDGDPANNVLATQVSYVASADIADYTVTVPQAIIIPGGSGTGNESGEVAIEGISTKDITVTADSSIVMTSSGSSTLTANVSLTPVTLAATDGTGTVVKTTGTVSASWAAATPKIDSWSGVIHYTVTVAE